LGCEIERSDINSLIVARLRGLLAHSRTAREELRRPNSLLDRLDQAALAKAFAVK
jgi:hypothetical protein